MGGCRISDDDDSRRINGDGQVHYHPGFYIADASVFPQPVGEPPSLSIAAWVFPCRKPYATLTGDGLQVRPQS